MKKNPVLFIVGPTAVGKSRIAIALAKSLRGEIVSADSMLVYKGMDIGTAKPTAQERAETPHHLIDLFEPKENFSVYEYRQRAMEEIEAITQRGNLPIVTGGSGLYVRALLEGVAVQPPANPKLRLELEREAREKGLSALYTRLQQALPEKAAKIKPTDQRRIIRALEIFQENQVALHTEKTAEEVSQKPLSAFGYHPCVIGLTRDRAELYAAIEARVDQMMSQGLLEEVKGLSLRPLSRTARQAVGYKELLEVLEGKCSLEDGIALVKKKSRHLAKRQWTWFKREQGIQWIETSSDRAFEEVFTEVLAMTQKSLK